MCNCAKFIRLWTITGFTMTENTIKGEILEEAELVSPCVEQAPCTQTSLASRLENPLLQVSCPDSSWTQQKHAQCICTTFVQLQ
jgi:hypothetical protein